MSEGTDVRAMRGMLGAAAMLLLAACGPKTAEQPSPDAAAAADTVAADTVAGDTAAAAGAQTAARPKETPPEGGRPADFTLPAKQEFTLDNGLEVTLVPWGDLPKALVQLRVNTGNADEGPNEVWLADLTGRLMEQGTTTRSAERLARDAAGLGGQVDVTVAPNQTSITGDVLGEHVPAMVALVADVARRPRFPAADLARLKTDMLRELSIQRSQPQPIALEKFRQVMYGNHAYGRVFPTEAMLQGYALAQVRGFYRRHFGADRSHLYIVGRFDSAAVQRAVRSAFGSWPRGAAPDQPPPAPKSERQVHLIDRPNAPQSTILLGLPVVDPSHPDYVALQVTNALLGGSFGSRITSNIRENKGYTYSPFSTLSSRLKDAYWAEQADVTTEATGASLKEIFYEIDRLRDSAPPAEELRGIQNYLAGTFVLGNSDRSTITNQLASLDLHGLPDSYMEEYVRKVYAVTPEEVQRIARTYLDPRQMQIVVVGDKAKIREQVAAYGTVVE